MLEMFLLSAILLAVLRTSYCETIYVSRSTCGTSYRLTDDSIKLKYSGASIDDECTFTFTSDELIPDLCTEPKEFDLNTCNVKVEYHNGLKTSFPDETYSCTRKQYANHCTSMSTLYIVFRKTGSSASILRTDNVELKVYKQDFSTDLVSVVKTSVYVIVGVVIGVIVLIIVLIIIVVCCCCRRRRNQGTTVYRSPQQATAVTTGAYPMQTSQQGYQPPPAGYQYPHPGGYQPPVSGYQPPPTGYQQYPPPENAGYQYSTAGYPPVAQQGYAGYQTGPDSSMTEKPTSLPSAPPMSATMEPPPYPGN